MASSATKKVRVELHSAIRDGLKERNWSAVRGAPGRYAAPELVVSPPLVLFVTVTIDADKFGGASLTADAVVQCTEVTDILVGFDRSSMPASFSRFPGDGLTRQLLDLGVETAGGLLDPKGNYFAWTVRDHDDVQSKADEFFAMIDGPLTRWAAARDTPANVLAQLDDPPAASFRFRTSGPAVRAVAGLALVQGQPDLARRAVPGYQPGTADEQERFALLERELASYFPVYGPLQRT